MDLLTLEVLAVETPLAPVRDWDGDVWHAACLLRFFSWSKNRGGTGTGHRMSYTNVVAPEALPSGARCFDRDCPHGRYKWTC